MPLRDHFHPPVFDVERWETIHMGWIVGMAQHLNRNVLSPRFHASAHAHHGVLTQTDVAAFDRGRGELRRPPEQGNGVAVAVWAPPQPTTLIGADFRDVDVFEVRLFDVHGARQLVAVVEVVSPGNKDRPEARAAFVTKCASFLQQGVSVVVIDVVTERLQNLHAELMRALHLDADAPLMEEEILYAASYRTTRPGERWQLDVWPYRLALGAVLPTIPVWLTDELVVPLECERTYEDVCAGFRLP